MDRIREFLELGPQKLGQIELFLELTRLQTLSVLQRLEDGGEIYREDGIWRKVNKCCCCDEPVAVVFNRVPYCVDHNPHK